MVKVGLELAVVAVLISNACGTSTSAATRTPVASAFPVASPKVTASWATFATGADKPHRTLGDGLEITDVEIGSGTVARSGDALTVRYIMWLSDGRQVDSSDATGQAFKFTLGTGMVIRGWDEGLPGMALGGTRRLVVPPALAYGAQGAIDPESGKYVVPPSATLVFIIQLVSDPT